MIPKARVLALAGISALLLWPASASAQRVRPAPVRGRVVVTSGFYRPYYYRPFFYPYYSPFYFGFGAFYDSFDGWYPYAGYPYGGYPYPPYSYYGRVWSSARIEVKPREAQVYLDGYYVGVVDQFDGVFQRLDVPTGEHELVIYMPGFQSIRERTLFRPGQTYHFKQVMQPLPPGAPPEPKPQPDPNARPAGPGPYGAPPAYGPPPGYGQDPYRPPPPPPPAGAPRMEPAPRGSQNRGGDFGTLTLRVQPEDAQVTIDGERWDSPQGGSRLSVQLAPGAHRVEVRKDGFRPYTSTVQIRPGEQQSLNISLPQGH